MNPPSIAVLVPGLKVNASPHAGQDAHASEQGFSSVLAGKVTEGAQPSDEQANIDLKSKDVSKRLVRLAAESKEDQLALESELVDQVEDETGLTPAEQETDSAASTQASLPAIFLDIAAHVSMHARERGREQATNTSVNTRLGADAGASKPNLTTVPTSLEGRSLQANREQNLVSAASLDPAHTEALRTNKERNTTPDTGALRTTKSLSAASTDAQTTTISATKPELTTATFAEEMNADRWTRSRHEHTFLGADRISAATVTNSEAPNNASLAPFTTVGASTPGSPMSPTIATPVNQAGWDAEFTNQVMMFARQASNGTHTAELRLDPPELGPLRISLSLNEGMASALFVSAHASVRQAIEAALPQLSQQLAQAGISLGDTHVGDQDQANFAFNQDSGSGTQQERAFAAGAATAGTTEASQPERPVSATTNLVDTFA